MRIVEPIFTVLLFALVMNICYSQSEDTHISSEAVDSLNQLFDELAQEGLNVKVEYLPDKSTFLIRTNRKGSLKKLYRMIITDIHPYGVYSYEDSEELYISIISRCAGNVFIDSTTSGQALRSHTTNQISIGPYDIDQREKINTLVNQLSEIVKIFTKDKKPDKSGKITLPEIKN